MDSQGHLKLLFLVNGELKLMFDRGLPYFYDIRRIIFALLDVNKDLISSIGGCITEGMGNQLNLCNSIFTARSF